MRIAELVAMGPCLETGSAVRTAEIVAQDHENHPGKWDAWICFNDEEACLVRYTPQEMALVGEALIRLSKRLPSNTQTQEGLLL